jgi:hypothetical protein
MQSQNWQVAMQHLQGLTVAPSPVPGAGAILCTTIWWLTAHIMGWQTRDVRWPCWRMLSSVNPPQLQGETEWQLVWRQGRQRWCIFAGRPIPTCFHPYPHHHAQVHLHEADAWQQA